MHIILIDSFTLLLALSFKKAQKELPISQTLVNKIGEKPLDKDKDPRNPDSWSVESDFAPSNVPVKEKYKKHAEKQDKNELPQSREHSSYSFFVEKITCYGLRCSD